MLGVGVAVQGGGVAVTLLAVGRRGSVAPLAVEPDHRSTREGSVQLGRGTRCPVAMAVGSRAGKAAGGVGRRGAVGRGKSSGRAQEDIGVGAAVMAVSFMAVLATEGIDAVMGRVRALGFVCPCVTGGITGGSAGNVSFGGVTVAGVATGNGEGALGVVVVMAEVTVDVGLAVLGNGRRQGVARLADAGIARITVVLDGGGLEEGRLLSQPVVQFIGSGGVGHIAIDKPDIGFRAVSLVNVTAMAIGTLNVLILAVVGTLPLVAVGADVHRICRCAATVGAEKEAVTGDQSPQDNRAGIIEGGAVGVSEMHAVTATAENLSAVESQG